MKTKTLKTKLLGLSKYCMTLLMIFQMLFGNVGTLSANAEEERSEPEVYTVSNATQLASYAYQGLITTDAIATQAPTEASFLADFVFVSDDGVSAYFDAGNKVSTVDGSPFDVMGLGIQDITEEDLSGFPIDEIQGSTKFGIPGQHIIFDMPVRLDIEVDLPDGDSVALYIKHEGDVDFGVSGLTSNPEATCTAGVASETSNFATVKDGVAIIYTCGASVIGVGSNSFVQNDNLGYAQFNFDGSLAGVVTGSGLDLDLVNGTVGVSSGAGFMQLANITPASLASWTDVNVTYTGTAPEVEIFACDGTSLFGPGTYTGSIDISSIDPTIVDCIYVELSIVDQSTEIDQVEVTWIPEGILLLDIAGPSNVSAGQCEEYVVRWSSSYTNQSEVLLTIPLPHTAGSTNTNYISGTITTGYNQFPFSDIIIEDMSAGGVVYTGMSPLTLPSGNTVQPNTLYREVENTTPGIMSVHNYIVCTDAGTENGVGYEFNANLEADNAVTETDSVSTTIDSTPNLFLLCETPQAQYIEGITTEVVEMTIQTYHVDSNEDTFDTMLSMDYSTILGALTGVCGFDDAEARSRIGVPAGFSAISTTGTVSSIDMGTFYVINNALYPDQTPNIIDTISTIDISGCGAELNLTDAVTYTVTAENFGPVQAPCGSWTYRPRRNDNVSIGDYVWFDDDRDGVQDPLESGIGGVEIELLLCSSDTALDGALVMTGITNLSGSYLFTGLAADSYRISIPSLPSPYDSGHGFTSLTAGSIDGSDINPADKESGCVNLIPNTDYLSLDAGIVSIDPTTGGGGGAGTTDGWFNKCMYSTTSNEYNYGKFDNDVIANETNREGIHSSTVGYYDNDCLDTDGAGTVSRGNTNVPTSETILEVNAEGESFFHINLHGDITSQSAQDTLKQDVVVIDRIPDNLTVTGSAVWTNENTLRQEQSPSVRGAVYCHDSIQDYGATMPALNSGAFDGSNIPLASAIGTGWSTTCDATSRWVLTYARCVNSAAYPAAVGSECEDAPNRYQYRVYVEPNTTPTNDQCDATVSNFVDDGTNHMYLSVGAVSSAPANDVLYDQTQPNTIGTFDYNATVTQSYSIYNTPNIQNFAISSDLIGPSELDVAGTGTYLFDLSTNFADDFAYTGGVVISLEAYMGVCPEVSNLTGAIAGRSYNNVTCELSGPVNAGGTGSVLGDPVYNLTPSGSRSEIEYDTNGNQLSSTQYYISGGVPVPSYRYEYSYDANGNETGYAEYYRNAGTSSWDPSWRSDYTVGPITYSGTYQEQTWEYFDYSWDGSARVPDYYYYDTSYSDSATGIEGYIYGESYRDGSTWIPSYYSTDITSGSGYYYDSFYRDGSAWVMDYAEDTQDTYDANGNTIESVSTYFDGTSFVNNYRYEYSYDANNYQDYMTGYSRNGSLWEVNSVTDYSYTASGDILFQEAYNYNASTDTYTPSYRRTYTRDANGNILLYIQENHDGSGGWRNSSKFEYVYDANNNVIEQTQSNVPIAGGPWVYSYQYFFEYDADGNQTSYEQYRWLSGEWVPQNGYDYEYDADGNQTRRIRYRNIGGERSPRQIYDNIFDEDGNRIASETYTVNDVQYPTQSSIYFDLFYPNMDPNITVTHSVSTTVTSTECMTSVSSANSVDTYYPETPTVVDPPVVDPPEIPEPYIPGLDQTANPVIETDKFLDKTAIIPSDMIVYTIQATNYGDALSPNTILIDPIPQGTDVNQVITEGDIDLVIADPYGNTLPLGGTGYNCPRCQIYFSDQALSPVYPDVSNAYVRSTVQPSFTLGVDNMDGTWSVPGALGTVTYVAIEMISDSAPGSSLLEGDDKRVGIVVDNISNVLGDIIKNTIMTMGDELLPSVSNTVYTTLIDQIINTLAGIVYHDVDQSDVYDGIDEGVGGVVVNLYNASGSLVDSMMTNPDGTYAFTGLVNGTYSVSYNPTGVLASSGYYNQPIYDSVANTGTVSDVLDGDVVGTTTIENIDLFNSVVGVTYNFGLIHPPTTIDGHVYHDVNVMSGYQIGDTFQGGITVYLLDSGGNVVDTQITSSTGYYLFEDVLEGDYELTYDLPFEATQFESFGGHLSGDATQTATGLVDGGPSALFIEVSNVTRGQDWDDNDFSYYLSYCGDGVIQSPNGERDGGPDNNGFEQCDGAALTGCMYPTDVCSSSCICTQTVDCPANVVGENSIGNTCDDGDVSTENDVIQDSCSCEGIPIACYDEGGVGSSCDDGNINTINDSIQSSCTCAGTPVECAQDSDCDNNLYCDGTESCDLNAFSCVSGTPPCGNVECSEVNDICPLHTFDLALEKSINTTTTPGPYNPGDDVVFTLTVTNQGTIDAYDIDLVDYFPTPDLVLNDATWTETSAGVAEQEDAIDSLAVGQSEEVTIRFTINESFTGTSIMNVAEIESADDDEDPNNTPPTDTDSTPDDDPENDDPTDDDPTNNEDDSDDEIIPVGNLASLAGTIFFDDENDDIYDGDDGIEGIPVYLLDEDANIVGQTVTDENGNYSFPNIPAGEYTVGYTNNSDYTPDSSIEGSEGGVPGLTTISEISLEAGENSLDNDFGLVELVSISGGIYLDDEDDDQYAGDQGLEGITVILYDEDGNIVATTTTDENGEYEFTDVNPGIYSVGYTNNTGFSPDSNIPGSTGGTSDGVTAIGSIDVTSGDSEYNDFGLILDQNGGGGGGGGSRYTPPSSPPLSGGSGGSTTGGSTSSGGIGGDAPQEKEEVLHSSAPEVIDPIETIIMKIKQNKLIPLEFHSSPKIIEPLQLPSTGADL